MSLHVIGVYSDGAVADLTTDLSWRSSASRVATVDLGDRGAGDVAGRRWGTAIISVRHADGLAASTVVKVWEHAEKPLF